MRLECLDTVKGDLLTVTYTMVVAITGDIRNLCRASHLEFLALFGGHSRLEYSVEDDVTGQAPQRHGARRPALGAQHLRRILLLRVQVLEKKKIHRWLFNHHECGGHRKALPIIRKHFLFFVE